MGNHTVAMVSGSVGKKPGDISFSFVFDEAYGLAQKGLDVHVIRMAFEKDELSCGIHFHGLDRKYDLHLIPFLLKHWRALPSRPLPLNPKTIHGLLGLYLYGLNVSRVVEESDIDLIHAHFAYPEGLAGLFAKRETKKPLIITVHGYDVNIVPEVGYGIRLHGRYDRIIRKVLASADAVICVSSDIYKKIYRIVEDESKMITLHNGVDLTIFNPNNDGSEVREQLKAVDRFLIITIRSLRPVYGIEYLVMAARIVADSLPSVLFVIGGDGPLSNQLRLLVNNLGLSDNIKLIGRIPRALVPSYLAACDLAVLPSLMEGLPLFALEAAASGKPIIATNVGGLSEIVKDQTNGLLVDAKDPRDLANKILLLAEDERARKKMGIESRKIAEKDFDINKRLNSLLSIYRNII